MTQRDVSDPVVALAPTDWLSRSNAPYSPSRRLFRAIIHFFSYHLILRRSWPATVHAGGFRLHVPPTLFATFLACLFASAGDP